MKKLSSEELAVIKKFRERKSKGELSSKALYDPKNLKELVKMRLCSDIINFRIASKFQQKEMANALDLTEAQVSEIMNYRIERFTVDFLLDVIELINRLIESKTIDAKPIKVELLLLAG